MILSWQPGLTRPCLEDWCWGGFFYEGSLQDFVTSEFPWVKKIIISFCQFSVWNIVTNRTSGSSAESGTPCGLFAWITMNTSSQKLIVPLDLLFETKSESNLYKQIPLYEYDKLANKRQGFFFCIRKQWVVGRNRKLGWALTGYESATFPRDKYWLT